MIVQGSSNVQVFFKETKALQSSRSPRLCKKNSDSQYQLQQNENTYCFSSLVRVPKRPPGEQTETISDISFRDTSTRSARLNRYESPRVHIKSSLTEIALQLERLELHCFQGISGRGFDRGAGPARLIRRGNESPRLQLAISSFSC